MTTINPFLQGNFGPLREEMTLDHLTVIGSLPYELNGLYLRNGPNPQFAPIGRYHWFDGDGMIHAVQLRDGHAIYRNRYVQTQALAIEQKHGHAEWTGLTDKPWRNWFNRVRYGLRGKNPANTSLVWHADKLMALWEYGQPYRIEPSTLETIGPHDFKGQLVSNFTAHPKVDPNTGEMLFFGYNLFSQPYLRYGIVSDTGALAHTAAIPLPKPTIIHDFAITRHYTIFMDLPLIFDLRRAIKRQVPLQFDPHQPARFGVMPRYGGAEDIRWFDVQPCYVYHTLNAYELNGEIVVTGCRLTDTDMLQAPIREQSHLHRWRLNLMSDQVHEAPLCDRVTEMPRINEAFMGSPHRYGYTVEYALSNQALTFTSVLKHDLVTGNCRQHAFGRNRFGGEAVFAARPNAKAEDDGWLLTYVYDAEREASELLILDAQNIDGEPAARVLLPKRIPYGFHGLWVSEEESSAVRNN